MLARCKFVTRNDCCKCTLPGNPKQQTFSPTWRMKLVYWQASLRHLHHSPSVPSCMYSKIVHLRFYSNLGWEEFWVTLILHLVSGIQTLHQKQVTYCVFVNCIIQPERKLPRPSTTWSCRYNNHWSCNFNRSHLHVNQRACNILQI